MAKFRNERGLPRIQNVELSEKNVRLRLILVAALLVIGFVAIAIGVNSCVSAQLGWQEVQVSSNKRNCSQDFICNYYYGSAGLDPTSERRQVAECYSRAVEDAYDLFNTGLEDTSMGNLTMVNAHPNEAVSVEPELYEALALIQESESRYVYLAPVYSEYRQVFSAELESLAEECDPAKNDVSKDFVQQVVAYAADPAHVSLELLNNNQVKLCVSQAYLQFADEYGLTEYLDLGWMKNAFIADFLAQRLEKAGHTNGYLASYDGYTRNLDKRGESYSFNLFDRADHEVFMAATMQYSQPMSIVFLRNFPMTSRDSSDYFVYSDRTITTARVDPADGMSKSATDNLVVYGSGVGCAEIALKAAPIYVCDTWNAASLQELMKDGIYSIWFDGENLMHNQKDLIVTMQEIEGTAYRAEYAGK
ncbi:MAG: hypothetical protein IKU17_10410 [Clostridia bacterium]|nr:hypothetical protein [Clostridia bacterium]